MDVDDLERNVLQDKDVLASVKTVKRSWYCGTHGSESLQMFCYAVSRIEIENTVMLDIWFYYIVTLVSFCGNRWLIC